MWQAESDSIPINWTLYHPTQRTYMPECQINCAVHRKCYSSSAVKEYHACSHQDTVVLVHTFAWCTYSKTRPHINTCNLAAAIGPNYRFCTNVIIHLHAWWLQGLLEDQASRHIVDRSVGAWDLTLIFIVSFSSLHAGWHYVYWDAATNPIYLGYLGTFLPSYTIYHNLIPDSWKPLAKWPWVSCWDLCVRALSSVHLSSSLYKNADHR